MVTLIHGDNEKAAYAKLSSLKDSFTGEKLSVDGKEPPEVLKEQLVANSLFEDTRQITLTNPGLKFFDAITFPPETTVIIYYSKLLTKSELASLQKKIPGLKIEEFKLDPLVFKLVESLAPHNSQAVYPLWQKYIATEEPEIALSMIARQTRLLLAAKTGSGFSDFDQLAPWQKQRLTAQASKFTQEELMTFQIALVNADYKVKSGKTPLGLAATLELVLLTL